ncbi:hypothetical protein ACSBR1_024207 [Camellia fascicularis]
MATTVGRGAQSMNTIYFKPMLRKAYHKKGSCGDMVSDAVKLNGGEEMKNKTSSLDGGGVSGDWWVPDHRTGIYYPKGHEKVIQDVPLDAGKDFLRINWFTNNEDFI